MVGRYRRRGRDALLVAAGFAALAALVAHAWVNARAAADFRALGVHSLGGISAAQAREVTRLQAMMLPKQVAGFGLWLLGVLVLLRRRDAVTRVFFLWCMALALYTASSAIATSLWERYPPGLISLFRTGFTCGWFFAPALFGHFCRVYAGASPQSRWRRLLPGFFYLMPLVALLATHVLSPGGITGAGGRLLWCGLAASWLGTLALGLVTLLRARRETLDPLRRKQIQFVLAGSLAYVLVFLHTFIAALAGWEVDPATVWAWLPHVLLLVTPLAFAYAILRHRLLDLDVVIRRSLVYTLLTLCMGGIFIALQQLAGAVLQTNTGATSLPAQTFAAIVVAALFGPTERRIGRVVEAVFNRRKLWRLQQLQRLSQEIHFIDDPARLEQVLVERVAEVMAVESAALHWRDAASGEYRLVRESGLTGLRREVCFRKDDGLAVWLALDRVPLEFAALERDDNYRRLDAAEKRHLAALGASLCVPLSAGGQLAGFLTLGPRQDRDLYGAEEKEALLALGDLAGAALRQAEMERRLRELEWERDHLLISGFASSCRGSKPAGQRVRES